MKLVYAACLGGEARLQRIRSPFSLYICLQAYPHFSDCPKVQTKPKETLEKDMDICEIRSKCAVGVVDLFPYAKCNSIHLFFYLFIFPIFLSLLLHL